MQRDFYVSFGFIILLLGNIHSHAQEAAYNYDHFDISNGLISDNVYKVLTDREGYDWIITYNGLQKFNGYDFETYTSRSGKTGSLSSNFVEDMFEDSDGDLIVVLEDGIDIYDKLTNRFTNLLSDLPFAEIRRNEISRLSSAVQDRNGSIWVNCNNQLVKINSTKSDFHIHDNSYQGRFVLNGDSTILWFITDRLIKSYELESNVLASADIWEIPNGDQIEYLNTIFFDSHNTCWVGTSQGLFIFDDSHIQMLDPSAAIPGLSDHPGGPLDQNITAIYEDYQNDLWIGSGSILYRVDRLTGKIHILQHETENPNSIKDEQITGIHGNKKGLVWITYLNEGVTRINIRTNDFRSFRFRANQENSLGGKTVRSVFKDNQGYIWLGLYNDGLDRYDPGSGKISHFKHNTEIPGSICSNYLASLYMDDRERLWVGSHDNGLCFTEKVYSSDLTFHTPAFLNSNDEINHIDGDSLGRIWFGTREGLGMYDYDSDEFNWVLNGHNVQSFIIDRNIIWIASWSHGLCKLCFDQDQFSSHAPEFDSTRSLYKTRLALREKEDVSVSANLSGLQNCISIGQDRQRNIWLGTYDQGLVRVVESGDDIRYKTYDITKGAPGNAIYGIAVDDSGYIWTSTEHGIGKFDPISEHFDNYYREDGLLSNYFMWKSYFKASDGEILFGSVDGLNAFYPDQIQRDTLSPRVFISELRINSTLVKYGDTIHGDVILDRHIAYEDTLVLNHWNRDFSFRFHTTGQVNPQRLQYSHMLAGYDQGWIVNESGNRIANYTNLSPGTYYFRVMATDHRTEADGTYEEKIVIILPPWWKTKLAFAFYILMILGLIFLITNSLIRFLALKHELILNEKVHQSKLMFFTNISHELKTPLSLIKAPLNDILNEKQLSPYNRKNLQLARKNADNLLSLVNELMEFRRTDTGNSSLRAEQIELTGFVNEISTQFERVADQKGVHFYYNIPVDPIKLWGDPKKIGRIVNNLLDNALKYTAEEGLVTLSIISNPLQHKFNPAYHTLQLNRADSNLEYVGVLVSDNGVGISKESLPRIFDRFYQIDAELASQHIGSGVGLALVKNLVLMHHGEIRVSSERGLGTDVLVIIPLGSRQLKEEERSMNEIEPVYPGELKNEASSKVTRISALDVSGGSKNMPLILLVEDHLDLRQYLRENLSDQYRVFEAGNGKEGLKLLSDIRPDLIITDWIMPVMDGASFIREIRMRESTTTIPVILLTAKDEFRDIQDGLNAGADQVIQKPFNLQLLKTQLERTIENHRERIRKFSLDNMANLTELKENRDAHFVQEVERIIRHNIRDNGLNAAVISREMGLSRTALYDRIRSLTGGTIGEYMQQIRLKQAIKLMLYEGITVSEVYVMVGFSSSSYMIRLFRKYYNTTPGEYIRNYLKATSN